MVTIINYRAVTSNSFPNRKLVRNANFQASPPPRLNKSRALEVEPSNLLFEQASEGALVHFKV